MNFGRPVSDANHFGSIVGDTSATLIPMNSILGGPLSVAYVRELGTDRTWYLNVYLNRTTPPTLNRIDVVLHGTPPEGATDPIVVTLWLLSKTNLDTSTSDLYADLAGIWPAYRDHVGNPPMVIQRRSDYWYLGAAVHDTHPDSQYGDVTLQLSAFPSKHYFQLTVLPGMFPLLDGVMEPNNPLLSTIPNRQSAYFDITPNALVDKKAVSDARDDASEGEKQASPQNLQVSQMTDKQRAALCYATLQGSQALQSSLACMYVSGALFKDGDDKYFKEAGLGQFDAMKRTMFAANAFLTASVIESRLPNGQATSNKLFALGKKRFDELRRYRNVPPRAAMYLSAIVGTNR